MNTRIVLGSCLLLFAVGCELQQEPTEPLASAELSSSSSGSDALFVFDAMVGVPRPYTGSANAIRGVNGGGLPWVIGRGEARLNHDGELRVKVEGLVLDPNDPTVISRGLAGVNPSATFRAILSCLTVDADGNAVTVNVQTDQFDATTGLGGGDGETREMVAPPNPCIAPVLFVTSGGGSWFAASSGAPVDPVSSNPLFRFNSLIGVPRPYTGSANPVRGVNGGGLPWVVNQGSQRLDEDGNLRGRTMGLVFDPNDPTVISRGLGNQNPVAALKAVLSCLTVDADGNAVTTNLETPTAPATTGLGAGDWRQQHALMGIPSPCIAPVTFVTSPGTSWFAASGF